MIHHYTTIDNLALILESKKIRFKRLDLLDDIKETAGLDDPILKLHKSIFVSCWTEDDEENIPLWKMYASIVNGVRISMPIEMFQQHLITPFTQENYQNSRTYYSPFTAKELFDNGKYLIINEFDYDGKDFYKEVKYDDNFIQLNNSQIIETDKKIRITFSELGRYKSTKWKFQKEVRFTIYTKPLNPAYSQTPARQYDYDNMKQWFENPDQYIDVPLSEKALKDMTITLAPCVSNSQRVIISSLIQTYKLHNIYKESDLKGHIRK